MLYSVISRETIGDLAASVGFTAANIPTTQPRTIYAVIQPIDGPIRITIDGTTPTADVGIKIAEDATVEIWGYAALIAFRCIDDNDTATLEVIYMGEGG